MPLEIDRVVFVALAVGWVGTAVVSALTSLRSTKAKLQWLFIMVLLPPIGVLAYLRQSWGNPRRRHLKLLAVLTVLVVTALVVDRFA